MRRRFGRGRRRTNAGDPKGSAIDAAAVMERIAQSGIAGVEALEPVALEGVPEDFAALGASDDVLVGYSPHGGSEALLAALALAASREGFTGTACAIAPGWSTAAQRRLGLLAPQDYTLRPLAAPQLLDAAGEVEALTPLEPLPVAPARVGRLLARAEDRDLFQRALAGLEGLAAKHGGAVRGVGSRVELVLLARRVASLEVAGGRVRLEVLQPDRFGQDLDGDSLATALDRLEGALRKRLNDRRVRGGEEGTRAALLPVLERAGGLRGARAWPVPSRGAEEIDLLGVDAEGRAVVAVARERLDLGSLSRALDAALDPRVKLPLLWGDPDLPLREDTPRLLLAASAIEPAALSALAAFDLSWEAYDVVTRRAGELALERREAGEVRAPAARPSFREADRRPPREEPPAADRGAREERFADRGPREERVGGGRPAREERPPRDDRPSADRAPRAESLEAERAPETPGAEGAPQREPAPAPRSARFEEVSLFDLDEEPRDGSDGAGRGRRRRGRRRGRRSRGDMPGEGGDEGREARAPRDRDAGPDLGGEPSPEEGGGRRSRRRRRGRPDSDAAPAPPGAASESLDDALDEDERLTPLTEDVPELEVPDLRYEDEETAEDEATEAESEQDRVRAERELRRRARLAKTVESAPPPPPRPPRRRAAFVVHADRISVLTAVLLARDVRLVEGFWVYPQEELMTFFRSVATDLRDETPIFLVGFTASPPARDTLQAASLYRGRLEWFDHHDWPPEDRVALESAVGEGAVHIDAGSESSLAAVLAERTRRSRFSDKLVELGTGRFTLHDYERWGRLWWHRLGEVAKRPGERRAEIDPLLSGRPSELAKAASRIEPPPPPPEVAYVSERDFRLVHFGGFVMVVLDVPAELDPHLVARIARERHAAQLSLARVEGGELLILAGDEGRARRGLDLGSMAQHLASKHEWVTALRDDDHVARVRIHDLAGQPDRLDEVISEIAMGRSIVEG